MHANDLRELMDSALDRDTVPQPLQALLDGEPEVAREWHAQQHVHRLLQGDPLVDPPMDFALRVMGRLEGELRRAPRWQVHLQRIGLVVAGTLIMLWSTATLSQHWQLEDVGPMSLSLLEASARGFFAMAGAWFETSAHPATSLLLYGGMVVLLAGAWFGVLVLPRAMARSVGREDAP